MICGLDVVLQNMHYNLEGERGVKGGLHQKISPCFLMGYVGGGVYLCTSVSPGITCLLKLSQTYAKEQLETAQTPAGYT